MIEVVNSTSPKVRTLKLSGCVGFDTLPDQLVNKSIGQGFDFNILCVGETALGKSTLLNTLFDQDFDCATSSHDLATPGVCVKTYDLKEAAVKLKLTIVETCGFGDQINNEKNIEPVIEYVDGQHEKYLQEELKLKRSTDIFHDMRINVCLYFIVPTGHSLKPLAVVAMKALENKVNIIPVIAKADSLSKTELLEFKNTILADIKSNEIKIYEFPTDDEAVRDVNAKMNKMIPFAVVGSREEVKVNGKSMRGRQYPWGTVQVDNEAHCEFVQLREALLRVNMENLRELTHKCHYETYRHKRLIDMGFSDDQNMSLQEIYEKRRELQRVELQQKEERMRDQFVQRVKEKEQVLKDAERELQKRFDDVKQSQAEEKKKLDENKRALENEMASFEKRKQLAEQAKQGAVTMKRKK